MYRLSERGLPGTDDADSLIEPEVRALAGTKVAYTFDEAVKSGELLSLKVRDLANGRILHDTLGPVPLAEFGRGFQSGYARIILRADGAVAWTAYAFDNPGLPGDKTPLVDVGLADRYGWRTLDRSTALDPVGSVDLNSLRLSGDVLSWTHGSAVRTALVH